MLNDKYKSKLSSFQTIDDFKRKEFGHTAVSDIEFYISDPINLVKRARGKYCKFAYYNKTVDAETDINQIETKNLNLLRK